MVWGRRFLDWGFRISDFRFIQGLKGIGFFDWGFGISDFGFIKRIEFLFYRE